MSGLNQLDPSVAQAEQFIEKQKLPPDKAVDYLLTKGVDPRLASLVMKYRMLKQSAANQPKQGQGQAPPPKTVSQDIDEQINSMAGQRGAGVSGLPVPNSTFNMAGGGIVAFDGGGMATPSDPTDLAAMQQQQLYQGIMDQQGQQNANVIAQGAAGGIVAFDEGGETDEDDLQSQQTAIYQRQLKNWQRQNAQNYLAKNQQLGVAPAPTQQNKKGGKIKHLEGGGPTTPDPSLPYYSPGAAAVLKPPDPMGDALQQLPLETRQEINAHNALGTPLTPQTAAIWQQIQAQHSSPGVAPQGVARGPIQHGPPPSPAAQQAGPAPINVPGAPPNPANFQQDMQQRGFPSPQGAGQPPQQPQPPPPQQGGSASMSAQARGPGMSVPMGPNGVPLAEQQLMQKQDAQLAAAKPLQISQYYDQLSAIADKQGIGAAAKQHLEYLNQLEGQLNDYKSKGNWMAITQAGFAMAQAATQNPHGGFLGALAVGGEAGAKAYQQNIAQYRDMSMKMNEQKYVVQQTQENLLNDRTKSALDEHNKALAHYDSYAARVEASQEQALGRVTSTEIAKMYTEAQIKAKINYNPEAYFAQRFGETKPGSPEYAELQQQYGDYQKLNKSVQAAGVNASAKNQADLDRLMTSSAYQAALNQSYSKNPDIAARGHAEIQRLEGLAGGVKNAQPNSPMSLQDYLNSQGFGPK